METQASDLPPSSDPAETAHSLTMAGEMLGLTHESGVTFSVPAVPVPQQQYQAFNTPQVTTPEDGQPLFQHQAVQHQQQCHTLPGHHPSLQNPGAAPQPPPPQQMSIALNNSMQPIEQHSSQPELIKVPYQQHLMAMAAAQNGQAQQQQQFSPPAVQLIGQSDRVTMVSPDHHQEVQPQQLMMGMAQGQIREMASDPQQMVTGLNQTVNMLPQQSQAPAQQPHAMDHSMASTPQVMVYSDQNVTHRPSHDYGQPPNMAMQNQQQNQMIQDILFGQQQPQSQDQVIAVAAAAAQQAMAQELARSRQQQPQPQQQFNTAAIPQTMVHDMARTDNIPTNVIMLQRPDQLGMRQQQQQQQQQQFSAPQQPMQQIVFANEQQMHQEQLQDAFSHEKIKQQAYSAAMLQQQQQQAMQASDAVMEDSNGDSRRSSVHQKITSPPSANEMTLQFQSTPALSESIAQKTDVSAKEFEGMSREQLIARLMTLEQEKRKAEQQNNHPVDVVEVKSETSTNVDEEDEDGPSTPPDSHRTDANTERTAESNAEGDELDEEDEDEEAEAETQDQAAPKPMQCLWKDCGQMCDGMQKLIAHISDNHVGSGKPTYRCEWEGCPRNQKPFTKRHKMYNHLRTHTGERPFVCPKAGCGKRFSRPDSLTTHIKTHSNVRPYICPVKGCQKAYYHSRSLKKHEKTHENTAASIPYPSTQPYTYAGQVPVDFIHNVPMQMQQHMIDSQQQQQPQHIPPPPIHPSPQTPQTSPPQHLAYTTSAPFDMMDTSVSTTTRQPQNFSMVMDPSAYDGERFDGFGGV